MAPGRLRGDQRGLTLVEIAVVLAVVGVLAAQGLPALKGWKEGLDLRNAASRLSETLLLSRTRSIVERREYTVSVDYAADTWSVVPAVATVRIPGTVDLHLDESDPDCPPLSLQDVVFRPNSTADASGFEAVYLRSRGGRVATRFRVKVLGATGKVSVERLVQGTWVGPF